MDIKYKDIFYQAEKEYSAYNFEFANTEYLLKSFEIAESECKSLLEKKLSLPAYDQCLKASHIFNLLRCARSNRCSAKKLNIFQE